MESLCWREGLHVMLPRSRRPSSRATTTLCRREFSSRAGPDSCSSHTLPRAPLWRSQSRGSSAAWPLMVFSSSRFLTQCIARRNSSGEEIPELAHRQLRQARLLLVREKRVLSRRNPELQIWSPLLLSLIHISEPTRLLSISYAVFCLKKKN